MHYYYRIRAYNSGGNSGYSNEADATTWSAPDSPGNLSASTASTTQINLSWSDNSSNEDGFKIERKTGSGGTWSQITTVGANTESYSNSGLSPGTTYYYRVRAYNGLGDSPYSNEAHATTGSLPGDPSNLNASTASTTRINLTWQDNSNNETGFRIERKTGAGGTWSQITTVSANTESFGNTGLNPGTTYYYRVRATNTWGNSGYSNEDHATTYASVEIEDRPSSSRSPWM